MVGQFTLGLAVAGPVLLLANLHLSGVQATDVQREIPFPMYLRVRLITTALALAALVLLAGLFGYATETAAVILIIGAMKALDALSDIFYGLFQQRERMDRVAKGMIVNGVVSLAAVVLALLITRSVVAAAVGAALGSAVTLMVLNLPAAAGVLRAGGESSGAAARGWLKTRPRVTRDAARRLLFRGVYAGLAATCVALTANMPRYFVNHFRGERDLGIFGALAYTLTPGLILVGALGQAAVPRLARYYHDGDKRAFRVFLTRLMLIALGLGLAGIALAAAVGPALLGVLYGPAYAEYGGLLVWLMIGSAFGYLSSIGGYAANATRAYDQLTLPYLAQTLLAAGCALLIIPAYGLLGATWTFLVTNLLGCLVPAFVFFRLRRAPA
jgi:O-antigen/teichoic acid export membrane protein